jgi:hypothetical protein
MALPASAVRSCNTSIILLISAVDAWVRWARLRTSSATTAKPRPCSPARAASMAALRASRLVCSAMPRITSSTMLALSVSSCCTTLPACSIWRETCSMLPMALRTTWLPWVEVREACLAAPMASVVLRATSLTVDCISFMAVAT